MLKSFANKNNIARHLSTFPSAAMKHEPPITQSINQSINQSISQSVSQSINQSVSQSVNLSINQSVSQSNTNFINVSQRLTRALIWDINLSNFSNVCFNNRALNAFLTFNMDQVRKEQLSRKNSFGLA